MAYPTGMLSLVLEQIDSGILNLKKFCQAAHAEMAAGSVSSGRILDVYSRLVQMRAELVTAAAKPGLSAYAQSQKNDGTLDVVAEFNALITKVDTCTQWISDNFPKDLVGGYLLAQTLGPQGPVDRAFTSAQTDGLRTQLATVIAAIA